MVTIHIDFTDGTEVSYIEGLELLEKDLNTDFTTNVLVFFTQNSFVTYPSDNVIVIDKHGRSIDRNELLTNGKNGEFRYIDREIGPRHNINKMLITNSFTWKQPEKRPIKFGTRYAETVASDEEENPDIDFCSRMPDYSKFTDM